MPIFEQLRQLGHHAVVQSPRRSDSPLEHLAATAAFQQAHAEPLPLRGDVHVARLCSFFYLRSRVSSLIFDLPRPRRVLFYPHGFRARSADIRRG